MSTLDREPSAGETVDPAEQDPDDPTAATTHYSLSRAVHARRSEYTRPHTIRIKIGTWNAAACPGTDKDLASWFVDGDGIEPAFDSRLAKLRITEDSGDFSSDTSPIQVVHASSSDAQDSESSQRQSDDAAQRPKIKALGGNDIGLYVLGLQEIVNLNVVHQSIYSDQGAVAKWQDALEAALPKGYTLVASQQLIGLLLLIYASPEIAPTISNESTISVGTGLLYYMGNKGAVVSRIVLGDTTSLVFANSHLASGHDQSSLDRRCWDYNKIVTQTKFAPIVYQGVEEEEGQKIGDEDFCFFFGDLNFRLGGLPGDDIRHLLTLHARGEYDITKKDDNLGEEGVIVLHNKDDDEDASGTSTPGLVSREASFNTSDDDEAGMELPDPDDFVPDPHDDPASLQATLDSLLPHDQLRQAIKDRKAFHEGWHEGPITFLPTYKYDVGTVGLFDSSEKKRAPSWCDRILFRTRKDFQKYSTKYKDGIEAQKRDDDMKQRGIDQAAEDENVLFDYDPSTDSSAETLITADNAYEIDEYNEDDDPDADVATIHEGQVDTISLDLYTSHQRIMSSDHKPLVALFTLTYDAVVPELKAKVHAEVAKELDRVENEARPEITIVFDGKDTSTNRNSSIDRNEGIDFGEVGYLQRKSQSLTIANTGRVPATINLSEKPENSGDNAKKSKWLDFGFVHDIIHESDETQNSSVGSTISLEPGETVSAIIRIEVRDLSLLRALNEENGKLEDILVLSVVNGRDYFMLIQATWRPSCFGRSVEELIRIPRGGITAFMNQRQKKGSIPYSLEVQSSSPTELFKLTDAIHSLTERVIADENMIEDIDVPRDKPGWPFSEQTSKDDDYEALRASIVAALEDDRSILDTLTADVPALKRLEIVSDTLLLFVRSMTDGIVSAPLWAQIEQAVPQLGSAKSPTEIEDVKSRVFDILSSAPYHNISFVFLTTMLDKVASELLPLNKDELEAVGSRDSASRLGKRSLSFRRNVGSAINEAAIQRRLAWERKVAEIFSVAICRTAPAANAKEKRATEDKMRALMENFIRRDPKA
ncbi:type II inositol-1,4,5-trisphosphate 5-phosphatase [Xylariaceae sp. FL0255]|nr:type II inositol-1,4,5-trisphosphate 5-phosphatase [Xylariaceae sp. FL0255]